LDKFDVVFRTPGISPLKKQLIKAKKRGVEISSQIKLFFDLCPAKIIGVTGTKGKGTTTSLIYEILKFNQLQIANSKQLKKSQVFLGGNIGTPPLMFLDKLTENDIVVLELSSFQLHDLEKSPNIAVILDIKLDHLDYHKNRSEYVKAKKNIVKFQKKDDFVVVNMDYLTSFEFGAVSPASNILYFSRKKFVDLGAYVRWDKDLKNGKIILNTLEKTYFICKTTEVTLKGRHNLENICAAITASFVAGAKINTIKKIVAKFKGLEHRLEFVNEINGVKYYNDSFSTTPETTIAAIKSFTEPIVLIVGGSEKGSDYSELGKEIVNACVKTVIAIGLTGKKIIKSIKQNNKLTKKQIKIIQNCKNMKDIINTAKKEANSGDVVILSPASASFDMFKNYKDRGDQFKDRVKKII